MQKSRVYEVSRSAERVEAMHLNMSHFADLHPLIQSITHIGDGPLYSVKERPISWIPLFISYRAKVLSRERIIEYHITGLPFRNVRLQYKFEEIHSNSSRLVFTITINSCLLGKHFLANKMLKAEDQVLRNLEDFE